MKGTTLVKCNNARCIHNKNSGYCLLKEIQLGVKGDCIEVEYPVLESAIVDHPQ